jgi:beta-lactam-binding protein with PASTA domain
MPDPPWPERPTNPEDDVPPEPPPGPPPEPGPGPPPEPSPFAPEPEETELLVPPLEETELLVPPPEPTEPLPPVPPDVPPPPGIPPAPPDLPPEEPPPDRHLWPWLVLLGILVVGGLLIAWAIGRGGDEQTQSTLVTTEPATTVVERVVPDVTGLTESQATAQLTSAGLQVRVVREASERPDGTVVDQQPAAGASVPRGSAVTLTVSSGPAVKEVEVPKLVGLSGEQAVAELSDLKLRAKATSRFSEQPQGIVVSQDPVPGTAVQEGSTVQIVVSKGPEQVTVPDVRGRSVDDARAALEDAGLVPNAFRVPSNEPEGVVVAQDPQPGETVARGSNVRINVSEGPPPPTTTTVVTTTVATTTVATTTTVPTTATTPTTTTAPTTTAPTTTTVPDTVGLTVGAARQALRAADLLAAVVYIDANLPADTVIAQFPTPGTTVKAGSRVRINVSRGPKPKPQATVPDVTNQDEATAATQLESAGFAAAPVDQATTDPSEDGVVLGQDPAAGTQAPTGSAVTLYIGRFAGG